MRASVRLGLLASAAACLLLSLPVGVRAQEGGRGFEEGYFDLSLPRVGRRIGLTTLVDGTGQVLVPLSPVLEHTGILGTFSPDSAVLEWPPDVWRTVLRFDEHVIETAGVTTVVPEGEWLQSGTEIFLSANALSLILGSGVDIVFSELTIVLEPNVAFPAIRRMDIDQRRLRERSVPGSSVPPGVEVPYPARNGGFVASWGVSGTEARGSRQGAFRGASGASVWGGALETGGTLSFGSTIATTLDDRFARWIRGFPENRWIRQLQLGTVFSEGPAGRRVMGIGASNAPFTTPRIYGEALIQPALPSGWEYEVYQGDYLVGVGSHETPGGIRTPLNYGNTPVRVRMIGPAGQEETKDLVYVVRPEMVPVGTWRYGLGGGACADAGCEDYGWAELRHGIDARFTAGAGVDRITIDEEPTSWRPYLLAIANPFNNLGTELQFQPGSLFRSSVQFQTAGGAAVSGAYAWFEPPGETSVLAGWNAQLSASAPVAALGGRFINMRALFRGAERNRIDLWQVSAATSIDRLYTTLEYESGLQARDLLTARAFASWPTVASLRDLSVSGAVGFSEIGADLFEVGASVRPVSSFTVSSAVRMRRESGATFILGMATRLKAGFGQARAARAPEGSSLFVSADGAIAHDSDMGAVMLPFEGVGRAGVAGAVFEDIDGDGMMGEDDVPIPDARIAIGTLRAKTDANGTYQAWLIEPYEALAVALDSLSVPFDRVAARPVTYIRPSPNVFTHVNIPLVRTRELTGRVITAGELGLGGIGVEILDETGVMVAGTRTFRDGEYYVPRLRPATYRVRIAASSLAAMGAVADPAEREVVVPMTGRDVIRVEDLRVR